MLHSIAKVNVQGEIKTVFDREKSGCMAFKHQHPSWFMKLVILFVGWCILFVLCWPVAILALVLAPVVWLISIPLRLVGISLEALFALIRTLLFLPARVLGYKNKS